jgi:hypothetical protein
VRQLRDPPLEDVDLTPVRFLRREAHFRREEAVVGEGRRDLRGQRGLGRLGGGSRGGRAELGDLRGRLDAAPAPELAQQAVPQRVLRAVGVQQRSEHRRAALDEHPMGALGVRLTRSPGAQDEDHAVGVLHQEPRLEPVEHRRRVHDEVPAALPDGREDRPEPLGRELARHRRARRSGGQHLQPRMVLGFLEAVRELRAAVQDVAQARVPQAEVAGGRRVRDVRLDERHRNAQVALQGDRRGRGDHAGPRAGLGGDERDPHRVVAAVEARERAPDDIGDPGDLGRQFARRRSARHSRCVHGHQLHRAIDFRFGIRREGSSGTRPRTGTPRARSQVSG